MDFLIRESLDTKNFKGLDSVMRHSLWFVLAKCQQANFFQWFLASLIFVSTSLFAGQHTDFSSNVPQIQPKHLSATFWQAKLTAADSLVLTDAQIVAFNQRQYQQATYLVKPLSLPNELPGKVIRDYILAISKPSKSKRYDLKGEVLSFDDYQVFIDNLAIKALESLEHTQQLSFALVTKRASLRTFPTTERVFSRPDDVDIDRFQESALFPGEAVAILHRSLDGEWAFVQNYHYRAWVKLDALAISDKKTIQGFIKASDRLIVTGSKVFTNFNPNNVQTSEVQLDMGVSLPLIAHQNLANYTVHGQNSYASYVVSLPTRNSNGNLVLEPTLIARNADVSIGYLPMTPANIIAQSFKFLGERYGWGHDYNARDCTGFIGEIFKTFGLLLPRNTGQQAKTFNELNVWSKQNGQEIKPEQLMVGDLFYMPGHVAMVIGQDIDTPFLIHDVYDMNAVDQTGQPVKGTLNGVSVTPLSAFPSYLDNATVIKRIAQFSTKR